MSFLDALMGRKFAPMIGLDISSSSVKLVELGQSASGEYVLERFGSESFEKGWIADGQIEKFDEAAALLTQPGTSSSADEFQAQVRAEQIRLALAQGKFTAAASFTAALPSCVPAASGAAAK